MFKVPQVSAQQHGSHRSAPAQLELVRWRMRSLLRRNTCFTLQGDRQVEDAQSPVACRYSIPRQAAGTCCVFVCRSWGVDANA